MKITHDNPYNRDAEIWTVEVSGLDIQKLGLRAHILELRGEDDPVMALLGLVRLAHVIQKAE